MIYILPVRLSSPLERFRAAESRVCRVGNLGLLLLSWSLICWVAMGESSDLD